MTMHFLHLEAISRRNSLTSSLLSLPMRMDVRKSPTSAPKEWYFPNVPTMATHCSWKIHSSPVLSGLAVEALLGRSVTVSGHLIAFETFVNQLKPVEQVSQFETGHCITMIDSVPVPRPGSHLLNRCWQTAHLLHEGQ